MNRANGIAYIVFFILVILGLRTGCIPTPDTTVSLPPSDAELESNSTINQYKNVQAHRGSSVGQVPSTLIIGSFNIQVFGIAKSNNEFVMQHLVDIARRFDLLAIQELRAENQSVIDNFVKRINADGSRFSSVVGTRQGTSISKEQYVYLFDTNKLRLTSQPYVAGDPTGEMHRPPLVASFECLGNPPGAGFTFTALNFHIDPDVVDLEFAAMEQIMPHIMMTHSSEDDFILLGDFNDSAQAMREFSWLRNQMPLVRSHWPTKPRSGRSIDNIVIDSVRTTEFREQSGVLNVASEYGLSVADAVRISDHFPVWALFSTHEEVSRMADARSAQSFR